MEFGTLLAAVGSLLCFVALMCIWSHAAALREGQKRQLEMAEMMNGHLHRIVLELVQVSMKLGPDHAPSQGLPGDTAPSEGREALGN